MTTTVFLTLNSKEEVKLGKHVVYIIAFAFFVTDQINVQIWFYIILNTTVACHHLLFCLKTENLGKEERETETFLHPCMKQILHLSALSQTNWFIFTDNIWEINYFYFEQAFL